jgi:hypothetical protein
LERIRFFAPFQFAVSCVACGSFLFFAVSEGRGATLCDQLSLSSESLRDGDMFVSTDTPERWSLFASFDNFPQSQAASFIYVVRAIPTNERQGAIVIKSGKRTSATERPATTVQLVRRDDRSEARCRNSTFLPNEVSISADSYSRYHDFGFNQDSLHSLRNFHVQYETRSGTCKSTDDTQADSAFDSRSNRSQFSFDPSVVKNGMRSQLVSLFFGPVFAALIGTTDLRSEIVRYETRSGLACVGFRIRISGPGQFIAVNDLEARNDVPPFRRRPESSWR